MIDLTGIQKMVNSEIEVFFCIYLIDHSFVYGERVYGSKWNVAVKSVQEIITCCQMYKCNKVIMVHSHPFAEVLPSEQDLKATISYVDSLKKYGIEVVDHLIVRGNKYFSFRENGLLSVV